MTKASGSNKQPAANYMQVTRSTTAELNKILPGGLPVTPSPVVTIKDIIDEPKIDNTNPFLGTILEESKAEDSPSINKLRYDFSSLKTSPKTPQFGEITGVTNIESGDGVGWGEPTSAKRPVHSRGSKQPEAGNIHWLYDIVEPLAVEQTDKRYFTEKIVHFMACKSLTELNKSPDNVTRMVNRVAKALELGSAYVGRRVTRMSLTRTEERTIFKPALDILEEVLTMVFRYEEDEKKGYEMDEGIYQALCTELLKLRSEAYDSLVMTGKGIPVLPRWGRDGNINTAWNRNDFEILGATYRAEVENFLAFLAKYHKFQYEKSEKEVTEREVLPPIETAVVTNQQNSVKLETSSVAKEVLEEADLQMDKTNLSDEHEAIRSDKYTINESESISRAFKANSLSHSKTWTDQNNPTSSFGHPLDNNNGKGMKDMFGKRTGENENQREADKSNQESSIPNRKTSTEKGNDHNAKKERHAGAPGGPPDDDDDDDDKDGNPGRRRGPDRPSRNPNESRGGQNPSLNPSNAYSEPQFDNRLKIDAIPTWDGNLDTLGRWVLKINRLSERSKTIYRQLGMLVPSRLSGTAETWYYSQGTETRSRIEANWGTLREAFGAYFMNRAYMDRQKARANRASYRDIDNPKETPSEYFIRKLELIELVYDYTDIEIINEIMSGAPSYWISMVTPHLYQKLEEFQLAIKFHENNLMNLGGIPSGNSGIYARENRNPFGRFRSARTNLVGWSKDTANPPFPKDDSTISLKGTPEDKGARPCRHCGSGKHWDPDCKYARKGEKRARVNLVSATDEDHSAQEAYDAMYYAEISDEESDF